jgi:hypothetical protein
MKISGYVRPAERGRGSLPLWAMIVVAVAVLHVGVGIAWAALRHQVKLRAAENQQEYVKYIDIAPMAAVPLATDADTVGAAAGEPEAPRAERAAP